MDSKLTQYLDSEMSKIIAHWLKNSCLLTLESEACLSELSCVLHTSVSVQQ